MGRFLRGPTPFQHGPRHPRGARVLQAERRISNLTAAWAPLPHTDCPPLTQALSWPPSPRPTSAFLLGPFSPSRQPYCAPSREASPPSRTAVCPPVIWSHFTCLSHTGRSDGSRTPRERLTWHVCPCPLPPGPLHTLALGIRCRSYASNASARPGQRSDGSAQELDPDSERKRGLGRGLGRWGPDHQGDRPALRHHRASRGARATSMSQPQGATRPSPENTRACGFWPPPLQATQPGHIRSWDPDLLRRKGLKTDRTRPKQTDTSCSPETAAQSCPPSNGWPRAGGPASSASIPRRACPSGRPGASRGQALLRLADARSPSHL